MKQILRNEELNEFSKESIVDFLYTHLERFRDEKDAIEKCINYAFSTAEGKGGFIVTGTLKGSLAGVVIINHTGMSGFIPENILVYIAVDGELRGKGIGKQLIEKAISLCHGDVKLHVEYDNPAKHLYERVGFTTKYAEMRFTKNL